MFGIGCIFLSVIGFSSAIYFHFKVNEERKEYQKAIQENEFLLKAFKQYKKDAPNGFKKFIKKEQKQ